MKFYALKHRKIILFLIILSIILISLLFSYLYANYKQKIEYKKWLQESQKNNSQDSSLDSDLDGLTDLEEINYGTDPNNPDSDNDSYQDGYEIKNGYDPNKPGKIEINSDGIDENDQLKIGNENNQNIDTSSNKFISKIEITDDSAKFIQDYYRNIANQNLTEAYEMSKKSVDYSIFQSWYFKTTKITLDKLVRIDEKKSSIELTLYEDKTYTRYGVVMTLGYKGDSPIKIERSEVKILSEGIIEGDNVINSQNRIADEYSFFNQNANKSLLISNSDFKSITGLNAQNYIVLDARENIEFENGHFPQSQHIRFADLKAGRWIELPKDKYIYIICWSGIRGKEVAEFLRTKKIVASYLENGANGWVEFGGKWVGSIKFNEKYTDPRYQIVFSTSEVKSKVNEGVVLVDTREPFKFKQEHIAGSLNIPIMYTSSIKMEEVFSQVPEKSQIITVCDDYVNCFDAKITGVELERQGHQFLGRYNKPWEYE